jgi:hypothetical protein
MTKKNTTGNIKIFVLKLVFIFWRPPLPGSTGLFG